MGERFCTALDWDDARIFLAIAQARSLSGAARSLGLNHATISRHLARLETALGSPLMERGGTHLALTSAGEAALIHAQRMEAAAAEFAQAAFGSDLLAGPVRVSAIALIADRFLAAILAGIARHHPQIQLELVADDRNVRLSSGEADIAIRMDRPATGDALARKLGDLRYSVYASPNYLKQTPEPDRRFLGFSAKQAVQGALGSHLAQLSGDNAFAMSCPSISAQAEAAAAGLGLALLPQFLGGPDARLLKVESAHYDWSQPVWLVVRRDVRKVARVRVIADAIVDQLGRSLAADKRAAPVGAAL